MILCLIGYSPVFQDFKELCGYPFRVIVNVPSYFLKINADVQF